MPGVSVSEPRIIKTNIRGPQPDGLPVVVTGRLCRCRMELPVKDGSARTFAALEQRARDLTFVPTILDSSDTLFDMECEEVLTDVRILSRRPEFADRCDWSKLKPLAWRQLLMRQPQFADKCDFMLGGKIMQFAQSYCIK